MQGSEGLSEILELGFGFGGGLRLRTRKGPNESQSHPKELETWFVAILMCRQIHHCYRSYFFFVSKSLTNRQFVLFSKIVSKIKKRQ